MIVIWAEKSFVAKELNLQLVELEAERATTLSKINLIIANNDVKERQGLSTLLAQIDRLNAIQSWQLLDHNNQLISERKAGGTSVQLGDEFVKPQYFYFYSDNDKQHLMTLKLYLKSKPLTPSIIGPREILFSSAIVALILLVLFSLFRWILQLEKYAVYLLTDTGNVSREGLGQTTNPVSQIINQLILKNTLLNKDKSELTEQIRKISYVDEVTELGNQLFFKAEFQVRLHNHEEDESGLFILLSFSDVDDSSEQVLTDDVLRRIANLIRHFANDISHALVARLRANDFALLLPNQSRDKTDNICKTLIEQLDKSIFDNTPIKEHFIDIGISAYKQGFDYYKIVAEADMALRNSQLQGGNNWFMYGEALADNKVRGQIRWRSFLQRVLDKRKLQLYGQKIHLFEQRAETLQEVLARIDDGKEVLTAETFLPMASSCGLASEFDRQVVDGVIKHCLYQEQEKKPCQFSINLFISSLLDERFIGWLVGKLSSYPELSKQITFEISEAHINRNLSNLRVVMPQLSELGVSWCIEHFGSPDEELAYLELLPISSVKIDRRIIFDIHKNTAQQLLLKSLNINLKSKKILVIAEGVEKAEDAAFIEKAGLDGGQGFFYSQPRRMKRIEKYLKVV